MARGYTTRKLEVWSIHAHVNDEPAHYHELFSALSTVGAADRTWRTEERFYSIPALKITGSTAELIAYEGPVDEQPIILDTANSQERSTPLNPDEIVATKTHAIVNLKTREAIIEYNHRGAKAQDIATILGQTARNLDGWNGTWVEFNPQVETEFVDAISDFDRIRVAQLKMSRPNMSWGDWEESLMDEADESNAQHMNTEFFARRGQSLSKDRGLVKFITEQVVEALTPFKSAAITGTRFGESAETKISTENHRTHQRVSVRLNENRQVDDEDMMRRLRSYDRDRSESDDE